MSAARPAEPVATVAVVGAGPVGVTTALLLAQRGFAVTVFDRETEIYGLPRAVGMDAEIQRVLQNAGLTDEVRSLTTPLAGAEFVTAAGERIIGGEFPTGGPFPLGHPPSVMFHQPWLEAMLRRAAVAAGVELRLGVEVDRVDQDPDSVVVHAAGQQHRADWLVAADGAASPIRKALGIGFVDQGFDQEWLVFDVELKGPAERLPRFAQQICAKERPVTFVPGHADFRRWELQLQPGESAEQMVDPGRVWQLISQWLTPEEATLHRAVVYRFHATVAEAMRDRRIFLAGDSAHQMPPFLGQGMCSGIRDAANLAWKLDMVERGTAGPALLDSYDAERRPHAEDMVAHAVDTGRLIDQLAGRLDSGVAMDAAYGGGREMPYLRHGVLAGDHARTGKPLPQPLIDGELFDERLGPDWSVLVGSEQRLPESVAADWRRIGAKVVTRPSAVFAAEIAAAAAVFVRPDRYVAAVAQGDHEVEAFSRRLLAAMDAPGSG